MAVPRPLQLLDFGAGQLWTACSQLFFLTSSTMYRLCCCGTVRLVAVSFALVHLSSQRPSSLIRSRAARSRVPKCGHGSQHGASDRRVAVHSKDLCSGFLQIVAKWSRHKHKPHRPRARCCGAVTGAGSALKQMIFFLTHLQPRPMASWGLCRLAVVSDFCSC